MEHNAVTRKPSGAARAVAVLAARLMAVVGVTVLSGFGCTPPVCTAEITTPDPLPNGSVGHAYFFQMTLSAHKCDYDLVHPFGVPGTYR
jgi:hypothetical protein